MKTTVTCRSIPVPNTTLAIQTESDPPYVWCTYHGNREDSVPQSVRGKRDFLIIISEQALTLFDFVIAAPGTPIPDGPVETALRTMTDEVRATLEALSANGCCIDHNMRRDLTHKDISRCPKQVATRALGRS
jgi:hypothetical protein